MRSDGRARRRLWSGVIVIILPMMCGAAPVGAAAPRGEAILPACQDVGDHTPPARVTPRLAWRADERGRLSAYDLELEGVGGPSGVSIRLSAIAFLDGPFGERWVFGDARRGISHLRVLDATRACLEAEVTIEGLVFSASVDPNTRVLVHDLVHPATRDELGIWRRPLADLPAGRRIFAGVDSPDEVGPVWANTFRWGPRGHLAARACGGSGCLTRFVDQSGRPSGFEIIADVDGEDAPRVDPRPVPQTGPDTWQPDDRLEYRWAPAEPSGWVRRAINDAAEDVEASRGSRAALFEYDPSGDDSVGLEPDMTGPCLAALACAYGIIPRWWQIRIRPHGTQVNWGTVRWCQAYDDPPNGCYDLEHAMIHEFGHIEGLAHPQDHGFRLGVLETVMALAPPQKPHVGWNMHRFGPCDVARLQRRYDVTHSTPLALCDRVATRLTLEVSPDPVGAFQPLTVTAILRVKDLAAYDRLGGTRLSGRDVIIERRLHGSNTWTAYDAPPGPAAGTYALSFRLDTSADFRATFDRPPDEGLDPSASGIVTVTVGPCTQPPCAESVPAGAGGP